MGLRENIWEDNLSHVELPTALTVSQAMPTREVIGLMKQMGVGCALVCEDQELRGIFTERDLIKRVLVSGVDFDVPIAHYMTPDPVTVRRTDSVGWAIRTMFQGHYRHLPVIDDQGTPAGLLSVKGIVQYLVDHVPVAVYNLPPQPRQVQEAREGA